MSVDETVNIMCDFAKWKAIDQYFHFVPFVFDVSKMKLKIFLSIIFDLGNLGSEVVPNDTSKKEQARQSLS